MTWRAPEDTKHGSEERATRRSGSSGRSTKSSPRAHRLSRTPEPALEGGDHDRLTQHPDTGSALPGGLTHGGAWADLGPHQGAREGTSPEARRPGRGEPRRAEQRDRG